MMISCPASKDESSAILSSTGCPAGTINQITRRGGIRATISSTILNKSRFALDLVAVSRVWNHGSVIRSWLVELAEKVFIQDPGLSSIKGVMHSSGEWLWAVCVINTDNVFNLTAGTNMDTSCIMVIFGGTGDLTHRKLMPALYNLQSTQRLSGNFAMVAVGRREKSSEDYRYEVHGSIRPGSSRAKKFIIGNLILMMTAVIPGWPVFYTS